MIKVKMPPKSQAKSGNKSVQSDVNIPIISVIDLPTVSADKERSLSFEDALEEIGFGRVQIGLLFVISLILMAVLNETMGIGYLIPAAQCDLSLTSERKGMLTGMTFFGIMVSSYFWGFLGDTQGRRRTILFSLFCSVVLTFISTFLKSYTLFLICRFVAGVFVSGYSATVYAYIGEFNTNKNRATIISWVSVSIGIATIFQPLCALWILSYDWKFELYDGYQFRPWRLLLLIYAAPGILGGLLLYRYPESPKYLLSQNRDKEALKIVQWMYRTNKGKKSHGDLQIGSFKSEASEVSGKNYKGLLLLASLKDQTFPIFKPPYLLKFVACSFMHFGTFGIGSGFGSFMPDILNRIQKSREMSPSSELRICEYLHLDVQKRPSNDSILANDICDDSVNPRVYIESAIIGVAFVLGFIAISLSIKPFGRRKIFACTLLTSGISGILITVVSSHYLIITFFAFFILCAGINVTIINGAACDFFPTNLRAMTVCVSMMFGRLGSAIATNLIGYLLERSCELTYYIFSGVAIICFAVSFILPS